MILKCLEASKGCSACNHFMTEAGLVLLEVVVFIDLLVVVFVPVWMDCKTPFSETFNSSLDHRSTYQRSP